MSVKDELLRELEGHRGIEISGQALADRLKVSRNAVWKAADALRREGYDIRAGAGSGYRLAEGSDKLSASALRCFLPPELADMEIVALKQVDSTNNEAKRRLAAGELPGLSLIVAEGQSAGRGRQGRGFFSPEGDGLYMTLVLHPGSALADALSLTTRAAVATARAIYGICGLQAQIKWVNDLYFQGKKICGILTEAITDFESGLAQSVVVGIGVNISTVDFPPELRASAGALHAEGLNRNELAARITTELTELCRDLGDMEYLDYYRQHCLVLGRDIEYYQDGEKRLGRAVAIDDRGGLVLLREDGEKITLSSGEVSVRVVSGE